MSLSLLIQSLFFSPLFRSAWAEVCAYYNGAYPYPILNVLSTPARLGLYLACSATFVGVLTVVRVIHNQLDKLWGRSWDTLDGQQGKGVEGKIDKKNKRK